MTMSPDMRASDEDRDRTISLVREAYAEGRLSSEEFQQRMEQAQQSRTYGELAALTTDLPVVPVSPPTPASPPGSGEVAVPGEKGADLRKAWGAWLGVSVLVNVIWGITWITDPGSPPYYWPIWVMGPWGAAMLVSWLSHRGGSSRG